MNVGSESICTITEMIQLPKTLSNLDPLTSYTVRVRAGNSVGMSPFSDEVTFSTFGKQKMTANLSRSFNISCFHNCDCTGGILIEATPMGVVTVGEVESVDLLCTLEGSDAQDNIEYLWERVGDSLPSSAQVVGGKSGGAKPYIN